MQPHIDHMAADFKAMYPASSGILGAFAHEYYLNIDDSSLEFGGLFDTRGDFDFPHEFHRFGNDVDIRLKVFDKTSGQLAVPFGKLKIQRALNRYVLKHRGTYADEGPIHVRFP